MMMMRKKKKEMKLEVTYRNNADLALESLLTSTLGVNENSG